MTRRITQKENKALKAQRRAQRAAWHTALDLAIGRYVTKVGRNVSNGEITRRVAEILGRAKVSESTISGYRKRTMPDAPMCVALLAAIEANPADVARDMFGPRTAAAVARASSGDVVPEQVIPFRWTRGRS